MLKGNTVYLRLLSQADLKDRVDWINDEENIQTLLFDWPTSFDKTLKWFNNVVFDNSKLNFSIVDKETDELIGMTGLLNIDRVNHHAQLYITIGNKKYRGKRLPDEVIPLVLEYGFTELELKKIYLYTLPNNERGRHVYERNGFKLDGVLRQQVYCRGKQQDLYVHSILKNEFEER
ncbi:MAG: GNAT family N-acetyltransferase [Ruminococcaceae bacterium]|jgi:RimJ/RimL family protein N-acetyltransferase|nr:GNAT family N-acetyltransferase [Oscillospiraceae bacterium]